MPVFFRSQNLRKLFGLLLVSLLLVPYQNCSRASFSNRNSYADSGPTQGGVVYDGKPGDFYAVAPNFKCEGKLATVATIRTGLNGQLLLTQNSEDKCETIKDQVVTEADITDYNPDFIGHKDLIFERLVNEPKYETLSRYPEVLCQPLSSKSQGYDVAIIFDDLMVEAAAKIYYADQKGDKGVVPEFMVSRDVTQLDAKFAADNFNLIIDRKELATQNIWTYPGKLTATVKGVAITQDVLCRMAAGRILDSVQGLTISANSTKPVNLNSLMPQGTNYTYRIASGEGSIDEQGLYTPSSSQGSATLEATDPAGKTRVFDIHAISTWNWTNGVVTSSLLDSQGNLYLAGGFTRVGHLQPAPKLAVIDTDLAENAVTCNFKSGFDGPVMAFAVSSSAIYVGGAFKHYRGQAAAGLVKLSRFCELDEQFHQVLGFDGQVFSLAIHGERNSIFVGGMFKQYRNVQSDNLVELNLTNGEVISSFSKGPNKHVSALALDEASNALFVGGYFDAWGSSQVSYLAKIDVKTKELDGSFSAAQGFNAGVRDLLLNEHSIYIGGDFTSYRGKSSLKIAKLNVKTGEPDLQFAPSAQGFVKGTGSASNGFVNSLALDKQSNSLFVGGAFTHYRSKPSFNLAKINSETGELDTAFTQSSGVGSSIQEYVSSLALDAKKQKLYVAGLFYTYRGLAQIEGLARLSSITGALDTEFAQRVSGFNQDYDNGGVSTLALDPANHTLWVGGNFDLANGSSVRVSGFAKLNTLTKALDPSFKSDLLANPGFPVYIQSMALDEQNQALYLGGYFESYSGSPALHLIKLNSQTAERDPKFTSPLQVGSQVRDIVLDSTSNALFIGGRLKTNLGLYSVAKLGMAQGGLDLSFGQSQPEIAYVNSLALLPSLNALIIAGEFTKMNGQTRSRIAWLNLGNGSLMENFSDPVGFDAKVQDMVFDGKETLYVIGEFKSYSGTALQGVTRFRLSASQVTHLPLSLPDLGFSYPRAIKLHAGSAIIAGSFSLTGSQGSLYTGAIRLLGDGQRDKNFKIFRSNIFESLALSQDGSKVHLGGYIDKNSPEAFLSGSNVLVNPVTGLAAD